MEIEYQFELSDEDEVHAYGSGTPADILAEASHYLRMFGDMEGIKLKFFIVTEVTQEQMQAIADKWEG